MARSRRRRPSDRLASYDELLSQPHITHDGTNIIAWLVEHPEALRSINDWYAQNISARLELEERPRVGYEAMLAPTGRPELRVNLLDTGEGNIQVLSVLAAITAAEQGFGPPIIALEEPESHLHPRLQMALATRIREAIEGGSDVRIILETHSEHLLLAVQKLVLTGFPREQLRLYWVEQLADGRTVATAVEVGADGSLDRHWPPGVFDDTLNLAAELIELQRQREQRQRHGFAGAVIWVLGCCYTLVSFIITISTVMDTPQSISDAVLEKLPGDASRDTSFVRCLRAAIEVSISASLLTDEGRTPSFSLLLELDDEGQGPSSGVLDGTDQNWRLDFPVAERSLTAKDVAANSSLSKAGTTFFLVSGADEEDGEPRLLISALTRPPEHFRTYLISDPRFLGITVLGPFHLVIEAHGREVAYVRAGRIQPVSSWNLPSVVRSVVYRRSHPDAQMYVPDHVINAAINRLGRSMWLSGTGGTIAIRGDDEDDKDEVGWKLSGKPLDFVGLMWGEAEIASGQGELEYHGDHARALENEYNLKKATDAANSAFSDLARFTQLDGAVILRSDLTLEGFGRKLTFNEKASYEYVKFDKGDEEGSEVPVPTLGGTRHKSAAHWAADRPGRIALVASQDKRLGWVFKREDGRIEYHQWRPRVLAGAWG